MNTSAVLRPLFWQADTILYWLQPTSEAESRRLTIFNYITSVLASSCPALKSARFYLSGSFASKTYLPNADIDIAVVFPVVGTKLVTAVADALIKEALNDSTRRNLASCDDVGIQHLQIRNVSFINGKVKLISAIVGNISVDISDGGAFLSLAAVALIEAADQLLGQDHLLKRSLLLIKAWCFYESGALAAAMFGIEPTPILTKGRLSSYAISVMVLSLFNEHADEHSGASVLDRDLSHPLNVLSRFLSVYSAFDFERFVLTIDGPLPLNPEESGKGRARLSSAQRAGTLGLRHRHRPRHVSGHERRPRPLQAAVHKARALLVRDRPVLAGSDRVSPSHPSHVRAINIIDPLDSANNLSQGISRPSARALIAGLELGRSRLQHFIAHRSSADHLGQPLDFVTHIFPVTLATFGGPPSFSSPSPQRHQPPPQSAEDSARQEVGDGLYRLILSARPSLAAATVRKVTGMILCNDLKEVASLADDPKRLHETLSAALSALKEWSHKEKCHVAETGEQLELVEGNGWRADLLDHPLQQSLPYRKHQPQSLENTEVLEMLRLGQLRFASGGPGDATPLDADAGEARSLKSDHASGTLMTCKLSDLGVLEIRRNYLTSNAIGLALLLLLLFVGHFAASEQNLHFVRSCPPVMGDPGLSCSCAEAPSGQPLPPLPPVQPLASLDGADMKPFECLSNPSDAGNSSKGEEPAAERANEMPAAAAAHVEGSVLDQDRLDRPAPAPARPQTAPDPPPLVESVWVMLGGSILLGEPTRKGSYRWLKDGIPLPLSSTDHRPAYLLLSSASQNDSGVYSCVESPKKGAKKRKRSVQETERKPPEFRYSIRLMVASAPQAVKRFESQSLLEGDTLRLVAKVEGLPTPRCRWLFNGQDLRLGHVEGAVLATRDEGSKLEVLGVTARHTGTYTCACANPVGSAVWEEALVSVRPRPNQQGAN